MPGEFFDIHCHILPGLDEGAATTDEALRMIDVAESDGVAGIVATPHVIRGVYDNSRETIRHATALLKTSRGGYPIYPGAEIRISRDLLDTAGRQCLPLLNDKTHLLIELPALGIPSMDTLELILKNLRAQDVVPLFAHPERNAAFLRDISLMKRLSRSGACFQATAMSITNHFGEGVRRKVFEMIRQGLIHVVASDAHDPRNRPPVLSAAFAAVAAEFGKLRAEELFCKTPLNIINGQGIS